MNTSTHPVAPEEVMALLDGELPTGRGEFVARHVELCSECATLATQFRGVSQAFSEWKVPAVSQRVQANILGSAQRRSSDGKIPGPRLFLRASVWGRKQWSVGLAATAAVIALAIFLSVPNRSFRTASSRSKGVAHWAISPYYQGPSNAIHQAPETSAPINGRATDSIALAQPQRQAIAADSNGLVQGSAPHSSSAFGAVTADGQVATNQVDQLTSGPMIARTVSLTLVVKDFAAARAMLDAILARHHAYAAELTVNTAEGAPRNLQASLRVPAPELDAALGELKSLGRVENESQSGEEVTQEHVDLVARLKNSRETEQRLQAILQERTGKIRDVLAVEQEIARVRGEIEQMEAEQKSLEHRVAFAAVNLSIAEVYKAQLIPPAVSFGTRLHNGLVAGYHNAAETVFGIVLFFAESGPMLLVWLFILGLPVLFLWRRYGRALDTV
jgi:hypothetical protein